MWISEETLAEKIHEAKKEGRALAPLLNKAHMDSLRFQIEELEKKLSFERKELEMYKTFLSGNGIKTN